MFNITGLRTTDTAKKLTADEDAWKSNRVANVKCYDKTRKVDKHTHFFFHSHSVSLPLVTIGTERFIDDTRNITGIPSTMNVGKGAKFKLVQLRFEPC